ncbi:MAG: iron uptake porin, partial [Hormoscilla sp.]
MSNILWKSLLLGSPAVVGAVIAVSDGAIASETGPQPVVGQTARIVAQAVPTPSLDQLVRSGNPGRDPKSMGQVTSVSQLRDVRPTDWAFQALQSLVERYGCIAGYPDGSYRGNRPLTRFEFAAGLNACLDRVNELIAAATTSTITRGDLTTLQRLQEEFAAELATLRGRVDALEARTAELQANQFSTTSKLTGEAIIGVTNAFGTDDDFSDNQTVMQARARLNFNTSFTGKDLLITRLQVGNFSRFNFQDANVSTGIFERSYASSGTGLQTFQFGGDTNGAFQLDTLAYMFNLSDGVKVALAANGGRFDNFTPTLNPFLEDFDGGNGAVSVFGQRNPIYRIGGGAGIGLNFSIGRAKLPLCVGPINLTAAYLAENANDPSESSGLFNGDYAALGQLTLTPFKRFSFAATYVHGYHTAGNPIFDNGLGREVVGTPFTLMVTDLGAPVTTNSYGGQISWQLSDSFAINGWFAYTDAIVEGKGD